eukprot:PhM_4_TR1306/c0_g1_i2/m.105316
MHREAYPLHVLRCEVSWCAKMSVDASSHEYARTPPMGIVAERPRIMRECSMKTVETRHAELLPLRLLDECNVGILQVRQQDVLLAVLQSCGIPLNDAEVGSGVWVDVAAASCRFSRIDMADNDEVHVDLV